MICFSGLTLAPVCCGAAGLQEGDPVLAELALQVQSGPTDVSHAQMLKEFRRADPKGTGQVSISEFQNILSKVMRHIWPHCTCPCVVRREQAP